MLGSSQELVVVMARVAKRDQDAFDILYHATNRKLYGIILRILGSRSLADEVLQEVYVKIWHKAADFDSNKASPVTWMAVIARNRALDEVRRPSHAKSTDALEDGPEIPAEFNDPLADMERSDRFKAMLTCLDALDGQKREMVLLAYFRGVSRDALAARYRHPTSTIKTWLHRSLAQLKTCVDQ